MFYSFSCFQVTHFSVLSCVQILNPFLHYRIHRGDSSYYKNIYFWEISSNLKHGYNFAEYGLIFKIQNLGDSKKSIAMNFNNVNACAHALEQKSFLENWLYLRNYKRYRNVVKRTFAQNEK